ncbi:hypothetical protein ATJ97_0187 [Georgenia soli]|uniref:Uncharacterized protein n=2 Tax=Georgenia soli TaxID=638953 RepID=A0A2A9F1N1_9MICO|nr:hypothetical protein ATJ97_0187 [Georgenia soli]
MMPTDLLPPDPAFATLFMVVTVLIAIGGLTVVIIAVKNFRRARQHGLDPFTVETDLAARVMESQLLAPRDASPIRARLDELAMLHRDGVISDEEYGRARAAALGN